MAHACPDICPGAGPALTALGGERLSQGDVAGALRVFEKATRLFPAVSLAWYNVAVAYGHAGLLQHAGEALSLSFELLPRHFPLTANSR